MTRGIATVSIGVRYAPAATLPLRRITKIKWQRTKPCQFIEKNYRRYSARVKVNQIKKPEFKKWKYAALTKRDDCSNGKITVEEYIDWNEAYFPNRKRKDKQST